MNVDPLARFNWQELDRRLGVKFSTRTHPHGVQLVATHAGMEFAHVLPQYRFEDSKATSALVLDVAEGNAGRRSAVAVHDLDVGVSAVDLIRDSGSHGSDSGRRHVAVRCIR